MNKDRLSSVMLVLFILSAFGSVGAFMEYAEPSPLAYTLFIWPVILGVVTWRLRVAVRKERAAAEAAAREVEEQARRAREEDEARRKEEQDKFRYENYAVAGVTFKNADGTDRQKILREIALNEYGTASVEFEEDTDLGEESGIEVWTEFGCVGFIRRSDKAKVRRFFDRPVQSAGLLVELFVNDDGQKIYRADVHIVMYRGDPAQAWYFDDLPKQ